MNQGTKQGLLQSGANQAGTQILKQFYSLHYPAKKHSGHHKLRVNSVMAVNQHYNPEIESEQETARRKRSLADKVSQQNHNLIKNNKERKQKEQQFSFKKMLSGRQQRKFIKEYFTSYPPKYIGSLQELSNHSSAVKNAMQRCKDQKMKISKVMASQKQSQDTKMDYLELKRKEIQEEKGNQIRAIYEQFFRKEYEQLYGNHAYSQFQARIHQTVSLFRAKVFGK